MPDLRLKGFSSDLPPGSVIEPHAHISHQIVHAISGVMRITTEQGVWVVPPGRALWLPANTTHEVRCIGHLEMRTVYLRGDHPAFPNTIQVSGITPFLREIMIKVATSFSDKQRPHLIALLVEEIADLQFEPLHLPKSNNPKIQILSQAFLETPENDKSLEGWATEFAMSPRTLMRLIQSETGLSFRELRRQARILAAIERLPNATSVTNIAMDVGFDSASAFSQAFKVVTGTSPKHYLR